MLAQDRRHGRRHPPRRERSVIIDGRVPHSILLEMFSDRGSGTLFYRNRNR